MLTFHIETIDTVIDEIQELLPAHCAEAFSHTLVGRVDAGSVDFSIYRALEQANALHITTARTKEGKLVGYAIYFLAPDAHNKSELTATSDAFYLHSEHRKGWDGFNMLKFTERKLADRGVKHIVNVLPFRPFRRGYFNFMKRLGYISASVQLVKTLGGETWHQ